MREKKINPLADYQFDFFKALYSGNKHYTCDFYYQREGYGHRYLVEMQEFPAKNKKLVIISENRPGELEIMMRESHITEDIKNQLFNLIKTNSKKRIERLK